MNYKKSLTMLAALGLMAFNVIAGNVDFNQARVTASNFMQHNKNATFKANSTANLKLTHAEPSKVSGNAYYVFNIDGGGWIIVAGDDRAKQVLAYGDKGNIDINNLPGNMKDYLNLYKNQIEEMQSYKGKVLPLKASHRATVIEPMLKSTWGQDEPMDRWCPMVSGERAAVGCGPLAMAQIMYYWKYPTDLPALDAYYIYGFGTVSALPAATADYSLMLDSYTIYNPATGGVSLGTYTDEQAEEVAKLSRYCGQACKVRYGSSSGAYTYDQRDAFKIMGFNENTKLYGIDPSYYCDNRNKFSQDEWIGLIYNELEAGRPIAYHNVDFIDGHAWVLDGVDADGKFHMNWGWYERYNGWFEFGAFTVYPNGETWNFNGSGNEMLIDLIPYEGYVIPGDDPQPTFIRGDIDGDEVVGIADLTALIDYLLSQNAEGISLEAADCDQDNEVNIADVSALIDYLLRGEW